MGANHLTYFIAFLNIPWHPEMVISVGPVTRGEKGTQFKTFLFTPVSVKGIGVWKWICDFLGNSLCGISSLRED